MIGFLSGRVAGRVPGGCLLDVGGVGYLVTCPAPTLAALPPEGAPCRLWTHLQAREDSLALFGFATEAERRQFEALLGVSGIGPKAALAVCSALAPEAFRSALARDDAAALAAVPGVGRRTAQRILVDLRDELAAPDADSGARARATSALENLGYSPAEVRAALNEIAPAADAATEEVVRSALQAMSRAGR